MFGFNGVLWSKWSVDLSWKAKRGMKPGDEGGIEPSSRLLFLRRSRKQHPRRRAAAPNIPTGSPTPRPIFWFRVSPSSLAGGEAGSRDALGVELALVGLVEESVAEPLREALEEDLVEVDNVTTDDTIAEGLFEADAADERAALLGIAYETDGVAWGDCQTLVD